MTYRGMRFTEKEIAEMRRGWATRGKYAEGAGLAAMTPPAPKPSKYHAIMEECQGIKFQSKKEARYFRELKARVSMGEVRYFLRQVPFDLAGVTDRGTPIRYRVDFMEILKDGSIRYIDVKGFRSQVYKLKRRMVEAAYPVRIEEA